MLSLVLLAHRRDHASYAALCHRLARLCLTAPPPGIMAAIAITHNLLRRHPGCIVLVHREGRSRAVEGADDSRRGGGADPESEAGETSRAVAENGGRRNAQQEQEDDRPSTAGKPSASQSAARRGDPYLAHEPDPAKSLAIHSSLWEFDAMRSHYCPEARLLPGRIRGALQQTPSGDDLPLSAD